MSIGLDHWGESDANATVQLVSKSTLGDSFHTFVYDGHTGEFLLSKPRLGTRPSLGNTLIMLVAQLHFGTLLGIVTKLLWGTLGILTCALAATGLLIYVERERRAQHRGVRLVRAMTVALSGGLPFATGVAFLFWVAAYALGVPDPMTAMTWAFLLTLTLSAVVGAVATTPTALMTTWMGSGIALIAVVAIAPLATGIGIVRVWDDPSLRHTLLVDIALVLVALACLGGAALLSQRQRFGTFASSTEGERLAAVGPERS